MSQLVHASRTSAPAARRRVSLGASGVRLFAAYWGSLALVDLTGHALVAAVTFLVVWTGACSIGQHPVVASAVGAIAWCFLTGFVVNTEGDLTVHTALDLVWLVVLTVAAFASSGLTRILRR